MTDEILALKEVAQYLKLAEKTAYKLAADGKLPGFKAGGSWRFKKEEIGEDPFSNIQQEDLYDLINDKGQGYNISS